MKKSLNLTFYNKIINKIRIGIFTYSWRNGGTQRMSALLLNYLYKIKLFNLFLFSQKYKQINEYIIPNDIKRIVIPKSELNSLPKKIYKKKLNIFIFQFPYDYTIKLLNNLKNNKIIFFQHYSLFYWLYKNYSSFNSLYKNYKDSKYVISLVPFENDYIFQKWGIRSLLMNNFVTYEYNFVISSDLSSKTILMVGRSHDKFKRLELGILAMEYVINEYPYYEMNIISNITNESILIKLVHNLNIKENIKFVGYSSTPEIYYKNCSLHIFPSISESFGLVLSETKIYGIPNILIGLDYLSLSKGGTFIIYDDMPEILAIQSLKILKNDITKNILAKEARRSMLKFKNEQLLKEWVKLIIAIYNGDNNYVELRKNQKYLSNKVLLNLLKNQIKLLKMRIPNFINITLKDFLNFSFLEQFKIN